MKRWLLAALIPSVVLSPGGPRQAPCRLGAVPVEFFGDYELRSTRYVDQRSQGGQWVFVTAIDIAEVGEVTIHSPGGGTTCVDALRVVLSTE